MMIMATLLPILPSDDDEHSIEQVDDDNDDDDDEGDEMDRSFEFGGILGEDGGLAVPASLMMGTHPEGWSYQAALDQIELSTRGMPSHQLPRMDVAALIAAKRKTIHQQQQQQQQQQQRLQHNAQNDGVQQNSSHNTAVTKVKDNKTVGRDEKSKTSDENDSSAKDVHSMDDRDANSSNSSRSSESESDKEEVGDDDNDDDISIDKSYQDIPDKDVLKTRAGGKDSIIDKQGDHDSDSVDNDDEDERDSNSTSDDEKNAKIEFKTKEERAKEAAYFDLGSSETVATDMDVFAQLNLSRPLLRGVASMGFVKPTPVQSAVIPLALAGRDICASAVTGSGKTAAFLLPLLEGMLHRYAGRTKAVVLTPTRELAAQCIGMMASLARFTKIRAVLIVGGSKNVNAQAAELRTRPDLVVATPGRLLDHITNSTGVGLEDVEYLVLDEADRLLDLGFQDEVHELVKSCPINRQTLLFSATMNTAVDDLIKLSLKRPVRIHITDKNGSMQSMNNGSGGRDIEVAPRLEQEFVRIRPGNEGIKREAMLLALLTRTFTRDAIVFFDTKVAAHRIMILCGLCGIKCAELHGNLTQQQRLTALENFRRQDVDVLLATDLAARGLDIDSVQTVINFEMPHQIETYIHRIGRTARAGRGGQSCTLIGEGRRHLMKVLIKDAEAKMIGKSRNKTAATSAAKASFETGVIRSRTIPTAVIEHFVTKITDLEPHVQEVLQAEEVAKMDRIAEMEVIKAQNLIQHADEIEGRPAREWFASNQQKKQLTEAALAERQRLIVEKMGTGVHRMTRKKRRAREAQQALKVAKEEETERAVNEGGTTKDKPAKPSTSATVRQEKRKLQEKRKELDAMSINDLDSASKAKKPKRPIGKDAAGDGSLFDDERVTHASKNKTSKSKQEATPKSYFEFRDFDPEKKLGKKRGHKAFKSKSKFKRRK